MLFRSPPKTRFNSPIPVSILVSVLPTTLSSTCGEAFSFMLFPVAVDLLSTIFCSKNVFQAPQAGHFPSHLGVFSKVQISESDEITYQSFLDQCSKAETFLLLADNCGEIVLDKLLVEQLKKRFPELKVAVMVRGGEVLNDATKEDAVYVGDRKSVV